MERVPQRKNFIYATAQKVPSRSAKKFLRSRADHHGARVTCEQQQPILQAGHYRIHVFAQSAENFVDAAKLLPDLRNFSANLSEFVGARCKSLRIAGG